MLRKKGVVGKFVEFYGPGLDEMTLEDRATIANMAPEYGATCGFFPIDAETIRYLKATAASPRASRWSRNTPRRRACSVRPRAPIPSSPTRWSWISTTRRAEPGRSAPAAGPRAADSGAHEFASALIDPSRRKTMPTRRANRWKATQYSIGHGDVVIAAITSCTNTSNPSVMVGAGLLAQKAVDKGLKTRPWVKTSLAPGSQIVTDYLRNPASTNRSTSWASRWSAMAARPASAIPVRCRRLSRKPSPTAISWPPPCCRATATSKAACIRRCAPIISPRRCWSSPMHLPAHQSQSDQASRSASTRRTIPSI